MNRPADRPPPVDLQRLTEVHVYYDGGDGGAPVLAGALYRRQSRTGDHLFFEYSQVWLGAQGAFALDETLDLVPGQMLMAPADQGSTLAPAFADCSPDRWGTVLMDRLEASQAQADGRRVRTLRAWDYLLGVNDPGRMGALRMRDPASGRWLNDADRGAPPLADLVQLEGVARAVDAGRDLNAEQELWLRNLVAPGSSLGGARPKAGFTDDQGDLWLAKFPGTQDTYDVGRWEYITWRLAGMAGIDMPESQLMRLSDLGSTFAVRRFDRDEHGRIHYASAWTLLNATSQGCYSYADLASVIEQYGDGDSIEDDLAQLFRRVAFNVMVANRDDHLRNHGFLRYGNGWVLSPAFDVNPNPHKTSHVLAVAGGDTAAGTAQLLGERRHYRLSQADAAQILQEVRDAVAQWQVVARQVGAPAFEIAMMGAVIDSAR